MRRLFILQIFILAIYLPTSVFALEATILPDGINVNNLKYISGGTSSCSTFFSPDNVRVTLLNNARSATPGQTVEFTTSIQNSNDYNLPTGDLYVLITEQRLAPSVFRPDDWSGPAASILHPLNGVNIGPKSKQNFGFSWKVPDSAASGKYYAYVKFVIGDQFVTNYRGEPNVINVDKPLASDVISISAPRQVTFVATSTAPVSVTYTIQNKSAKEITVPVYIQFSAHDWPSDIPIDAIDKVIKIPARSSQKITYTIPIRSLPLGFVEIKVGEGSIAAAYSTTFVQENAILQPNLFEAGLTSSSDGTQRVFVCVEGLLNSKNKTPYSATFTITNDTGKVLEKVSEVIPTTKNITVISSKIGVIHNSKYTLKVDLNSPKSIIDTVSLSYNCGERDCVSGKGVNNAPLSQNRHVPYELLGIIVLINLVIIAVYVVVKKRGSKALLLTIGFFLLITLFPQQSKASEVTNWRTVITAPDRQYFYKSDKFYDFDYPLITSTWWATSSYSVFGYRDQEFRDGYAGSPYGGGSGAVLWPSIWHSLYVVTQGLDLYSRDSYFDYDRSNDTYYFKGNYGDTSGSVTRIPIGTKIGLFFTADAPYVPASSEYDASGHTISWGYGQIEGGLPHAGLGKYVTSFTATSTFGCHDDTVSIYTGTYTQYIDNPTREGCFHEYNASLRLIKPTLSVTGLSSTFSCEALASDGTMECTANALGTSTPTLNVGSLQGAMYGQRVQETHVGNGIWTIYPDQTLISKSTFTLPGYSRTPFGSLVVYQPNRAPNPPTIATVYRGNTETNFLFSISSTDIDPGDHMYFRVDEDNDGFFESDVAAAYGYYDPQTGLHNAQPDYPDTVNNFSVANNRILYFTGTFNTPGTTTIQAYTIDTDGTHSSTTTYAFDVPQASVAPQNIYANTGTVCGGAIDLNWDIVSGSEYYKLYRYDSDTGYYNFVASTTSATYTDALGNNPSDSYYYYKVSSYSSVSGDSAKSDYAPAAPSVSCNAPPSPPGNFVASSTSSLCGGKMNLSWSAATGATGYQAYRYVGGYPQMIYTGTALSFNDSGLEESQYYSYKIEAYNSFGTSSPAYSDNTSSGTCNIPVCGNNICEAGETRNNCPVDCAPQCSNTKDDDGDGMIDATGSSTAPNTAPDPQCLDTNGNPNPDDNLEDVLGCTRDNVTVNNNSTHAFFTRRVVADNIGSPKVCDMQKGQAGNGGRIGGANTGNGEATIMTCKNGVLTYLDQTVVPATTTIDADPGYFPYAACRANVKFKEI